MDLWIRSQDKRVLTKVDEIWISSQNTIYCNDDWEAGKYETEERALEILDEIQKMNFANNPNVELTTYGYVYIMPEE